MKHLKRTFLVLGFLFEYMIPLVLFGYVVPFTHGEIKEGLTKGGFFALGLLVIFVAKRVKVYVQRMKNATAREIILSVFPIAFWVLASIGMNAIVSAVASFLLYWNKILIFIVLGRLCYVIAGTFDQEENKNE